MIEALLAAKEGTVPELFKTTEKFKEAAIRDNNGHKVELDKPLRDMRIPDIKQRDPVDIPLSGRDLSHKGVSDRLNIDQPLTSITIEERLHTLKDNSTETPENKMHKSESEGLSADEKRSLKEETGWSDEIIDSIGSKDEAEIYKKAGLKEEEINGKKCLIREDIDMEQKDELGRTNKERMENGQAPIAKNGETVELHHIGQKADSPLAELTTQEHRGKGNDTILHDKQKESEIDRTVFAEERQKHWESRAEGIYS